MACVSHRPHFAQDDSYLVPLSGGGRCGCSLLLRTRRRLLSATSWLARALVVTSRLCHCIHQCLRKWPQEFQAPGLPAPPSPPRPTLRCESLNCVLSFEYSTEGAEHGKNSRPRRRPPRGLSSIRRFCDAATQSRLKKPAQKQRITGVPSMCPYGVLLS